jgi:hypothetical protein
MFSCFFYFRFKNVAKETMQRNVPAAISVVEFLSKHNVEIIPSLQHAVNDKWGSGEKVPHILIAGRGSSKVKLSLYTS